MDIQDILELLRARSKEYEQSSKDEQSCRCCPNPSQDRYDYLMEGIDEAIQIIEDNLAGEA